MKRCQIYFYVAPHISFSVEPVNADFIEADPVVVHQTKKWEASLEFTPVRNETIADVICFTPRS